MLAEAVEHLVRGIVDHPDDVQVTAKSCAVVICSRSGFIPRTSGASSAAPAVPPAHCAPSSARCPRTVRSGLTSSTSTVAESHNASTEARSA